MDLNHFGFQGITFQRGVDAFVAPSVLVGIDGAIAAAHAHGIDQRAVAIALPFGDVRAAALVNRTWTVADAARIHHPNALVLVVAHPVAVCIGFAVASTHACGVKHVALTIASVLRDVFAKRGIDRPRQTFALVVARLGVVAPLARLRFAAAIVKVGLRVIVAGKFICAARHVIVNARSIVVEGFRIVVEGFHVRASATLAHRAHLEDIPEFLILNALLEDLHLDLA